jgi:hypothetical protein
MRLGGQRSTFLTTVRAALFGRQPAPAAAAPPREQELIAELRATLPAECATARAIDSGAPWEKIARCAIDEGYAGFAEQLSRFVETRLRRDA